MKFPLQGVIAAGLAAVFATNLLALPAQADTHYPIIEITPIAGFDLGGAAFPISGKAGALPGQDGNIGNGSVNVNLSGTIPITKEISAIYVRNTGVGNANAALGSVNFGGLTIYPGGQRDIFQNYELQEKVKSFTFSEGFATRTRNCCPNAADPIARSINSREFHTGNFGVTWVSPSLSFLNHGVFVLNETVKTQNRNPSPLVLADEQAAGLTNIAAGGPRRIWTMTQAATVVLPIDIKRGFTVSGTYIWGPLDFFMDAAYPYYYSLWSLSASKRITKDVDFVLRTENTVQRPQNDPFNTPDGAIHAVSAEALLNFRVDFNKILHK